MAGEPVEPDCSAFDLAGSRPDVDHLAGNAFLPVPHGDYRVNPNPDSGLGRERAHGSLRHPVLLQASPELFGIPHRSLDRDPAPGGAEHKVAADKSGRAGHKKFGDGGFHN